LDHVARTRGRCKADDAAGIPFIEYLGMEGVLVVWNASTER
jgi:hypothetical protein